MFILLVGPKGSGKSHIGRIIERRLGVHFFHVEPLWMAYHAQCKSLGRKPTVAEGIRAVHPKIAEALSEEEIVNAVEGAMAAQARASSGSQPEAWTQP